jgi:TP901 family phage tail tape measure protein
MAFQVGELFVQLNLDSSKFSTQFDKIEAQLKAFAKEPHIVKVSAQVVGASVLSQVKTDLQGASQAAQNTSAQFTALGGTIRTAFAVSIGNILTQPLMQLGSVLTGIIPSAASFEQGMANIKAVLNPTAQEFDALSQKALQLGRDTAFSATESASAIEMLAKNGLDATQILDGAADATVAFAAAAGSNLATAADVATDAMLSFGLSAEDLDQVVNEAVGTMNASKFGVDDYRLALGQAGGAAGSLGVTLTDFNTVIAATSNRFASGSDAGTSFKTFLLRLTPTTKEAADRMRELGIITADGTNRFYDAQGNLLPFIEILKVLQETMGNLNDSDLAAFGKDIFGQDAIRTLTGLLDTSVGRFNNLQKAITETDAAAAAATRLDTFNGAIKILQSSIEGASIAVGSQLLPSLTGIVNAVIPVVNAISGIADAIGGSQEAFNNLSPQAQMVVLAFQDISSGINGAIAEIQTILSNLVSSIESYFGGIIDAAYGWGNNVGGQFASGLAASIGSVADSVAGIGDVLSYWLQPGSPPRVAPDLDKWGSEVGEVYYDAIGSANYSGLMDIGMGIVKSFVTPFETADYSAITDFTNQVKAVLDNLQAENKINEVDAITSVIGTKAAFTQAIAELRNTGAVSRQTFDSIIDSAGAAGQQVAQLTVGYLQWRAATEQVTRAQLDLTKAQEKLNSVQAEFNEQTRDLREQLEKIRKEQELADIQDQIKEQEKLATAVGGDGSIQAKAKRELIRLALEQQIAEKAIEFSDRIAEAQREVDTAKDKLELAKAQEQAQRQQYELIQQQIAAQKEQNELIKEQNKLMKGEKSGGGGGGGSKAPEIDKDKAAQEAYAYSIATTAEKLEILKGKLAGVQEGSAEYYKILGQINQVTAQQQQEDLKAAKELEAKEKAQRDYEYSIADSAGKLAMLKKELAGVEEGSVEYYKILGQIRQLEQTEAKKGAGVGGGGITVPSTDEEKPESTPVEDLRKQWQEERDAREAARQEQENFNESQSRAAIAFETLKEKAQPFIDLLRNNLVPILAGLLTPAVAGLASILGGALAGAFAALLSPIGLLSVAVFALALAWQNNFANIQEYTAQALAAVSSIISSGLAIAQQFWTEHGAKITEVANQIWAKIQSVFATIFQIIVTVLSGVASFIQQNQGAIANIIFAVWNQIQNFINNAMSIIQNIVNIVLAAINGDWSTVWNEILALGQNIITLIGTAIRDGLAVILSLFGVNTADFLKIWDGFGILITNATDTFLKSVGNIIAIQFILLESSWDTLVSNITSVWDTLKSKIPDGIKEAVEGAIKKLGELVEDAKKAATSVGESFGSGLIEGIKSKIQGAIDAAKRLINAAKGAAEEAQDSASPSKDMMKVGVDYGDGYIIGIQDTLSKAVGTVSTAISDFTGVSIPQMQPATVGASNVNYYFTIDARGSDISEDRFREIIKQETNTQARRGNIRGR